MKIANWKILTTGAVAAGLAIGATSTFAGDDRTAVDAIHLEDVVTPATLDGRNSGLLEAGGLTVDIDSPISAATIDAVDSPDSPASPVSPASPDSPASPVSPASPGSPGSVS